MDPAIGPIDCACVIHGQAYSWTYVERLYNMLNRHITPGIRLHVYTEADRPVPNPMIKHELTTWPITSPKRSWWYKMQLFNPVHHAGPLLYFDLDTVVVGNIDWIWQQPTEYFWAIRDFKHLWRPTWNGINSSVMIWDTQKFAWIWDDFCSKNINATVKIFHGDQDYLNTVLDDKNRRFFDMELVKSWRWQCKDGGLDMKTRLYNSLNSGTVVDHKTAIMVFHGRPKPHHIQDLVVDKYWKINAK